MFFPKKSHRLISWGNGACCNNLLEVQYIFEPNKSSKKFNKHECYLILLTLGFLQLIWAWGTSFHDITVKHLEKLEFYRTQFSQHWTGVVLFWIIPKPNVSKKSKITIWIGFQWITKKYATWMNDLIIQMNWPESSRRSCDFLSEAS